MWHNGRKQKSAVCVVDIYTTLELSSANFLLHFPSYSTSWVMTCIGHIVLREMKERGVQVRLVTFISVTSYYTGLFNLSLTACLAAIWAILYFFKLFLPLRPKSHWNYKSSCRLHLLRANNHFIFLFHLLLRFHISAFRALWPYDVNCTHVYHIGPMSQMCNIWLL